MSLYNFSVVQYLLTSSPPYSVSEDTSSSDVFWCLVQLIEAYTSDLLNPSRRPCSCQGEGLYQMGNRRSDRVLGAHQWRARPRFLPHSHQALIHPLEWQFSDWGAVLQLR